MKTPPPNPHRAARWSAATLAALALAGAHCTTVRAAPEQLAARASALRVRPVELASGSGAVVHGWFAPGRAGSGAVLLLHGIGASRLEMADRAVFLHAAGYSVLLIDFRAHGESTGETPTYGGLESRDALAAVRFLRDAAPGERIGVVGVSMGGAAALLGPAPLPVDALVLESVYPTIDDAVRDRLRAWFGPIGVAFSPVVMAWMFPREGVTPGELRPIDRIAEQTAPVFVLSGTDDRYTTEREARALYDHARAPKRFWAVKGAAHVDLHAFAPAEYERRVGAFLEENLRARPATAMRAISAAR